ncbi:TetR/AcrR family transcriptional regulator [Arachnia propionica]|uniref:TetR/AcrR family transcriptional regulator n=1 Tax=Arachnia propionica TaxID=1750 RepID=A0A3P1WUS6_9ACTN|nr:TetR/AcrR family transcriptional regulator [Arachnia propionica]RRD49961.1 TetR/AcrR family transcriptional regulator [Arachnia propionica]
MTELTPRREATVTRLVEAAIEQFATHGIDATSVEQICEAAGFSRGAFYSNFASKDDLCAAMIQLFQDRLLDALENTITSLPDEAGTEARIEQVLDTVSSVISPTPQMTLALLEIKLRAQRNPELHRRLTEADERTRPRQVAFIEALADSLGVRFTLSFDEVLRVFEALFFYNAHCGEASRARTVMAPLALALIKR